MQIRRAVAAVLTAVALVGGGATLTACSDPAGLDRRDGVPDDHVHVERYASGQAVAGSTTPQRVLVEDSGRPVGAAVAEPGQTLLDAGLAAGLPMPYSCTVGSCGECVVKLLAGKVSQQEPNCLTAQQKTDGQILTCTSSPLTDVTLDVRQPL